MARVKIKRIPQALSGLEVKMQPGLYGTNGNRQFTLPNRVDSQKFAQQPVEARKNLSAVPREEANLEAEGGETAVVNIDGIPAHFNITGKRHSEGGVPLNLPDNSFIFSDTAKMKIKDPNIQKEFGMSYKKGGYTPAEIAKKFDINKYRQILSDPNTDDLQRKSAEMMVSNANLKLGKLAFVQEAMKGLPQGVPVIAMPYLITNQIDPAAFAQTEAQPEEPDADMGISRYGGNMVSQFDKKKYGGLPMAQEGNLGEALSYFEKRKEEKEQSKLEQEAKRQQQIDYLNKIEKIKKDLYYKKMQEQSDLYKKETLKQQEQKVLSLINQLKQAEQNKGLIKDVDAHERKIENARKEYEKLAQKMGVPVTISISAKGPMYKSKEQQENIGSSYKISEGEKEYYNKKNKAGIEKTTAQSKPKTSVLVPAPAKKKAETKTAVEEDVDFGEWSQYIVK